MVNNFFDKIFLLNLDRRKDRLEKCITILESHNIEYERFSAIDGSKIDGDMGPLLKGEIGCRTSHLNIIKKAKKEKLNSILILEDDFEMCDNFIESFESTIKQLPVDWEWLYFGGSHFEEPTIMSGNIYKVNKTYTTHAYAIKKEIYDKLIETLEVSEPADVRLSLLQKELNVYVTIPHLITQRDGYSDIQNNNVSYNGIRESKLNVSK